MGIKSMIPADQLPDFYRAKAADYDAKAIKLRAKADELEKDFAEFGITDNLVLTMPKIPSFQLNAERLRNALKEKSYRVSDLAMLFRVSVQEVDAIVNEEGSRIVHVGRGWLKRKEDVSEYAVEDADEERATVEAADKLLNDIL